MRNTVRLLVAAMLAVSGTAVVVGAPAGAAGTGGAPGGTFTASCVLGPLTSTRTFTAVAHAPDSVAPGSTFSVGTTVDYPVAAGLTAGNAYFDVVGGDPAQPRIFQEPGAPAISGVLELTANGSPGTSVDVALHSFGAGLLLDGASASEVCTPVHRLIVARVGIGVPQVSIGDAAVVEGSSGTRALAFAVSLSRPASTDVSVGFTTEDGTATAGSDYVAQSGSVTIPAGFVSLFSTVTVRVRGDALVEPTENLRVRLHDPVGAVLWRGIGTGRIIDDDPEHGPRISIGDSRVVEGARGTRSARFVVSLSQPAAQQTFFHYRTVDGTAVAGVDYRAQEFDFFIPAGKSSITVPVPVLSDSTPEAAKSFTVQLVGATGAVVGRAKGVGTIIDDD